VGRRVLKLLEFILGLSKEHNVLGLLGGQEFAAISCVILDMLLDQLIDRDVYHAVLDGEVGTRSIDAEALLVVNNDHSWLQKRLKSLALGFLRGSVGLERGDDADSPVLNLLPNYAKVVSDLCLPCIGLSLELSLLLL